MMVKRLVKIARRRNQHNKIGPPQYIGKCDTLNIFMLKSFDNLSSEYCADSVGIIQASCFMIY
jgi:hypothetical protein